MVQSENFEKTNLITQQGSPFWTFYYSHSCTNCVEVLEVEEYSHCTDGFMLLEAFGQHAENYE